jgi:hypothetical protein
MFPGSIVFSPPVSGAVFAPAKNDKLLFAGKSIYMNMNMDLTSGTSYTSSTSDTRVIALSGGDIVIEGDVELYAFRGLSGGVSAGTLVLSVLDDYRQQDSRSTLTPRPKCGARCISAGMCT